MVPVQRTSYIYNPNCWYFKKIKNELVLYLLCTVSTGISRTRYSSTVHVPVQLTTVNSQYFVIKEDYQLFTR